MKTPWIIAGSLLSLLTAGGCYDDGPAQDYVPHEVEAEGENETSGTESAGGETSPGTTITGASSDSSSDTDTNTDTNTDTDTNDGDGPGGPVAPDAEDVGYDAPPSIDALLIDGEASESVLITSARTSLVEVLASDDRSLESVTISIDGEPVVTLTEPPYTFAWTIDDIVAADPHEVLAEVRDNSDQRTDAHVSVDFNLPEGGTGLWSDAVSQLYAGTVEDLTISPKGDVLAAGSRSLDYDDHLIQAVVRSLDPRTGAPKLSIIYPKDDAVDGAYQAQAIAVRDDGTIAVAGSFVPAQDPNKTPRPWLALFTRTGQKIAAQVLSDLRGEVNDLAIWDGDLILAGELVHSGSHAAWIAYADDELDIVWEKTITVPGDQWSSASSLAVSDAGDLFVAGTTFDGALHRALAARLDSDGAIIWGDSLPLLGESGDFAEAIIIGTGGDILVGGSIAYEYGQRMSLRWLHPSDGQTRESFSIPSASEGDQRVHSLAMDHHGRIYVIGTIGDLDDNLNAVVYKRSLDGGASLWSQIYDHAEDPFDRGRALAVDRHGYVYAGGSRSELSWPRWWLQGHHP